MEIAAPRPKTEGLNLMKRVQVLVVGAGPVGTTAAYRLAKAGIDVMVVEALAGCPEDMRASTMHPPTLDMMAELGVLEDLEVQGLRAPVYQYRNRRSGEVIEFDMAELSDISRHPYRLQCEQFKLSRLLVRKLEALQPGSVRFLHRLVGFEQDADGITAQVETPFAIETIRADYVIGADGANSSVRKWTGTEFEGFTYPERFLTLSTAYPIEKHFDRLVSVNYVADVEEWCVLLRVPAFWRILVPTHSDVTDEELLSDAYKDSVLDRLTHNGPAVATSHRTLYRVHQRVAKSFRSGRALLAGDAAHLNNPLGGFGMNSGIHDVWNLTEKLREILKDGGDGDALLDRYDRQRRQIAHSFVQTQTIENKRMMESGNGEQRSEMEIQLESVVKDDARRRAYLLRQSMYQSLAEEAGIG